MPILHQFLDAQLHHGNLSEETNNLTISCHDPLVAHVGPRSGGSIARGLQRTATWTSFMEGADVPHSALRSSSSRVWTSAEFLSTGTPNVPTIPPAIASSSRGSGAKSSFIVRVSASYSSGAGKGLGNGAFWGRGDRPPPPSKDHPIATPTPEAWSSQAAMDTIVGGYGRDEASHDFVFEQKVFALFLFICTLFGIPLGLYIEHQWRRSQALAKAQEKVAKDDDSGSASRRSSGREISSRRSSS